MSSTIQIRGNNELKQKSNMIIQEIKLKIHEESDLYSSYDPDQKLLSEDVTLYLAHNYLDKHRKSNEKYTLRIISDTPVNQ